MRSQEFTGKTTQEAIDAGLAAFGVTIADVHVDVLQEGAKGLFGLFGSKLARVRMTVMEEEKEDDHGLSDLLGSFSLNEQAPQRKKKPAAPKQDAPKAEAKAEEKAETKAEVKAEKKDAPKKEMPKAEKKTEKAEAKAEKKAVKTEAKAEKAEQKAEEKADAAAEKRAEEKEKRERKPRPKKKPEQKPAKEAEKKDYQPMEPAQTFTPTEPPVMHAEDTIAGRAQRFLMDVTDRMGVKVDVYVDDSREDNLYIHMVGDTLGILIGRRGETLDALQYLTSLQVNKGREGYIRVTLDTENYRAKREDSLRRLAQRMANRAQKTGRKVVLEPMNPYERRVLHTALQNNPAVTTHSEGEEPNRRVVIMLANQPEKAEKAEKGEGKAEKGEGKSSSRRSRSRRRGRRGPKPEAAAAAQETAEVTAAPETPVDVLGGEE